MLSRKTRSILMDIHRTLHGKLLGGEECPSEVVYADSVEGLRVGLYASIGRGSFRDVPFPLVPHDGEPLLVEDVERMMDIVELSCPLIGKEIAFVLVEEAPREGGRRRLRVRISGPILPPLGKRAGGTPHRGEASPKKRRTSSPTPRPVETPKAPELQPREPGSRDEDTPPQTHGGRDPPGIPCTDGVPRDSGVALAEPGGGGTAMPDGRLFSAPPFPVVPRLVLPKDGVEEEWTPPRPSKALLENLGAIHPVEVFYLWTPPYVQGLWVDAIPALRLGLGAELYPTEANGIPQWITCEESLRAVDRAVAAARANPAGRSGPVSYVCGMFGARAMIYILSGAVGRLPRTPGAARKCFDLWIKTVPTFSGAPPASWNLCSSIPGYLPRRWILEGFMAGFCGESPFLSGYIIPLRPVLGDADLHTLSTLYDTCSAEIIRTGSIWGAGRALASYLRANGALPPAHAYSLGIAIGTSIEMSLGLMKEYGISNSHILLIFPRLLLSSVSHPSEDHSIREAIFGFYSGVIESLPFT